MEIIRQAAKYGIVGIGNTLLTLIIIWIMTKWFGANDVFSNLIGYTIGLVNSFLWNKKWTFSSSVNWKKGAVRFFIVFVVCYLMQLALLLVLNNYYIINPPLYSFFNAVLPMFKIDAKFYNQMLAMLFYTAINFVLNKIYTFKS